MAIETFEYIDDLNVANPTATDNVSEGDDHLRGLKTTLKNTFPNVTGAINATETELNYVDGVTSDIQTQLGTKLPLAGGTMTGDVSLGDNVKAKFGAGDDLQIYHDGSDNHSRIVEAHSTGQLIVAAANIVLTNTGETKNSL